MCQMKQLKQGQLLFVMKDLEMNGCQIKKGTRLMVEKASIKNQKFTIICTVLDGQYTNKLLTFSSDDVDHSISTMEEYIRANAIKQPGNLHVGDTYYTTNQMMFDGDACGYLTVPIFSPIKVVKIIDPEDVFYGYVICQFVKNEHNCEIWLSCSDIMSGIAIDEELYQSLNRPKQIINCVYCEDNLPLVKGYGSTTQISGNNLMTTIFGCEGNKLFEGKINYCPICGREL